MPSLLQIILGICAPIIAGFSVYIGYQQWKLSAYKLKHDLFEKRWKVYAATNDVIVSYINGDDEAQTKTYQEFNLKRIDAKFLFHQELSNYLDQLNNALTELKTATRMLTSQSMLADSPERSKVEKQVNDNSEWLRSQIEAIVPMFCEYLDLSRL